MAEGRDIIYRYMHDQRASLLDEEKIAQRLEAQHYAIANQLASKAALEARKFAAINHADNMREAIKKLGEEPCA